MAGSLRSVPERCIEEAQQLLGPQLPPPSNAKAGGHTLRQSSPKPRYGQRKGAEPC